MQGTCYTEVPDGWPSRFQSKLGQGLDQHLLFLRKLTSKISVLGVGVLLSLSFVKVYWLQKTASHEKSSVVSQISLTSTPLVATRKIPRVPHVRASQQGHRIRGVNPLVRLANARLRSRARATCKAAAQVIHSSATAPALQAQIDLTSVTFGDAGGAVLRLSDVDLAAGQKQLLVHVDWAVQRGERWAVVGQNGCGKSSLLRAITGTSSLQDDCRGSILVQRRTRVGYLVQTAVSGSTRTVKEEAASHMVKLQRAQAALDAASSACEAAAGAPSTAQLEALAEAQADFEKAGGYDAEARVSRVLDGLGFSQADQERSCDEFSGGWQMRIALARMLLSEPDLLLLDEPTNHLDAKARDWLGQYLSRYSGTMVIVSHDVTLLSKMDCVAEVTRGTLRTYKAGWTAYENQRVQDALVASRTYEKQQQRAAELQQFIDKWGAGTKASAANSRKKALEKLEAEMGDAPPPIPSEDGDVAADSKTQTLRLSKPPPAPQELLRLDDVNIGYGSSAQSSTPILSGVKLTVERGARMVLLGPNGAGKSTLLKALAGRLQVTSGSREENDGTKMAIFSQDLAQELNPENTALDEVLERVPKADMQSARDTLGALGLSGEAAVRPIGCLSGGEKARVAFAFIALQPANLILLDEPNNHLDTTILKVVEEGLSASSWKGALVVSSHMRSFCEALNPTHVVHVVSGGVTVYDRGLLPSDWTWLEQVMDTKKMLDASSPLGKQDQKVLRMAANAARKKMNALEKKIETDEAKIAGLDAELAGCGSDVSRAVELSEQRDLLQARVEEYFEELVELEEQIK